MSIAAITGNDPASLLPANATVTEIRLSRALTPRQQLDDLADQLLRLRSRRPAPLQPYLAAEWFLSPFAKHFGTTQDLIEAGLPWLQLRGTVAAVKLALSWIDHSVQLEEDGPYLHLELEHPATLAELGDVIQLVNNSIPAHVALYRLHSGYDLRHAVWDESLWDESIWDADSGVWEDDTLVSFGQHHKALGRSDHLMQAWSARTHTFPLRAVYLRASYWDISVWDEDDLPIPQGMQCYTESAIYSQRMGHRFSLAPHFSIAHAQHVWDESCWDDDQKPYDRIFVESIEHPMVWDVDCWDESAHRYVVESIDRLSIVNTGVHSDNVHARRNAWSNQETGSASQTIDVANSWHGDWDSGRWGNISLSTVRTEQIYTSDYTSLAMTHAQTNWQGEWDQRRWIAAVFIYSEEEQR